MHTRRHEDERVEARKQSESDDALAHKIEDASHLRLAANARAAAHLCLGALGHQYLEAAAHTAARALRFELVVVADGFILAVAP